MVLRACQLEKEATCVSKGQDKEALKSVNDLPPPISICCKVQTRIENEKQHTKILIWGEGVGSTYHLPSVGHTV